MAQTQQELLAKYFELKDQMNELQRQLSSVDNELKLTAEHKIGDVITWTTKRTKREGGIFDYTTTVIGETKNRAVVHTIKTFPHKDNNGNLSVGFSYMFRYLKNDNTLGKNEAWPENYEWTGENIDIYKSR